MPNFIGLTLVCRYKAVLLKDIAHIAMLTLGVNDTCDAHRPHGSLGNLYLFTFRIGSETFLSSLLSFILFVI
jgi:hypothetical protein